MRRVLLPLLMGSAAIAAVLLRTPLAEANAGRRLPGMRYAPEPRLAKLLSFGQRSSAANLLWLSAIGDLSRDFGDPERKRRWLHTVFAAITTLEPTFATVYSFGATYCTMIDKDLDRAVELLEKGVACNPDNLKLAVELATTYYMDRKDRKSALRVLERVVNDPRCDTLTKGFYSSLLVDGREDFAALAQWVNWLDHPNELVKENAQLQQERSKRRIALRAIDEFKSRCGRPPRTRDELRMPGLMAPEVVDVVLESLEISVACKPRFPRMEELDRRNRLRRANYWVTQFRSENGRAPTLDELLSNQWVTLPSPLPDQHYEIVGDEVRLVEDGGE